MNTSNPSSNGSQSDLQSFTIPQKKPLTVSPSDDVSMLIETISGRLINVTDPRPEDILLNDIAWATSRIPRFAGHTITQVPYNVAQHSVYVSELLEELLGSTNGFELDQRTRKAIGSIVLRGDINEVLIKALLHDAHEAYTGDIPSPIKKIPELKETFKIIEMKLDHAIRMQFQLHEPSEDEQIVIKYCDKLAQAIEGYQFMPSRGLNWNLPKPSLVKLQQFPDPKDAMQSYEDFVQRYEYLVEQ